MHTQRNAHEVDDLDDLGVGENSIDPLREEDRRIHNKAVGVSDVFSNGVSNRNKKRARINRAAKALAVQPLTKKSTKQIMLEAGFLPAQANNPCIVKSITNSSAFAVAFARYGVGPNKIANIVADGISAEVQMTTRKGVPVMRDDGTPVMVADHTARRGYVDIALKVSGGYHESVKKGIEINAELLAIVTRIEEMPLEDAKNVAEGDMSALEDASVEPVGESSLSG